jgi:translation elongation factor EF-1alpha
MMKGGEAKSKAEIMVKKKVGKITHYYGKIGVAVIEVSSKLVVGDKIKFVHNGENLFEETIESMQFEHKNIESAKKGDEIGLKVTKPVRPGVEVYKAE